MAEGSLYEFRITATNLVGIGPPSDPSKLFKCEAWTAPEPGKTVSPGLTPGYLACTRGAGRRGGFRGSSPGLTSLCSQQASVTLHRSRHHYHVPGPGQSCALGGPAPSCGPWTHRAVTGTESLALKCEAGGAPTPGCSPSRGCCGQRLVQGRPAPGELLPKGQTEASAQQERLQLGQSGDSRTLLTVYSLRSPPPRPRGTTWDYVGPRRPPRGASGSKVNIDKISAFTQGSTF